MHERSPKHRLANPAAISSYAMRIISEDVPGGSADGTDVLHRYAMVLFSGEGESKREIRFCGPRAKFPIRSTTNPPPTAPNVLH